MRLPALPLLALSLLLGACSSFQARTPEAKLTVPPAVRAENKVTTFGEFPSYNPQGQYFKLLIERRDYELLLSGRAVVDVIVNADGTVQDAAIFESSGDPDYDQMALRLYKNSRYSLRLSPGDPAPYVVRQEFASRGRNVRGDTTGDSYARDELTQQKYSSQKYSDVSPMGTGAKHPMDK